MYSFFVMNLVTVATATPVSRPIYNIAHMINTRSQIDKWLSYGANAIETDVTFEKDGTPKYLYHGFPCDFGRNCFRWDWINDYITAVRERTVPSSPKFNRGFVLIMFDVKIADLNKNVLWTAGMKFADIALIPLYSDTSSKLKVTFSILDFSLKDFMKGLLARLKLKRPDIISKIGFEINSEKNLTDPQDLEEAFKKIGVTPGHMWLSNGVTNWFIPVKKSSIRKKLISLVNYKDSSDGYVSKVYTWSVNLRSTARFFLETGIDGIISNNPQNVIKAVNDINGGRGNGTPGEKFKLATLEDNPFERVKGH